MKLRKGGRVRGKVKGKGSRRFLRAYALAAAGMLCGVLVFAACGEEYTRISTEVDNFTLQTVALEAGSSHTFDLEEIFSESGLAIEKYVIEGGEDKNYTVRGNTITARGTGICPVNVSLYVPSEDTRYVCSLGTLYSYDEKDFTPVSTADELRGMALDGKYILKSDIDLAGRDWEPVGNYPIDNVFSGMLINPDGYTIENLTISSAENVFHGPYGGCAGGLFGSMQGGFVYGVKLENVRIDVSDFQGNSYSEAGGIAAVINSSYLKDCKTLRKGQGFDEKEKTIGAGKRPSAVRRRRREFFQNGGGDGRAELYPGRKFHADVGGENFGVDADARDAGPDSVGVRHPFHQHAAGLFSAVENRVFPQLSADDRPDERIDGFGEIVQGRDGTGPEGEGHIHSAGFGGKAFAPARAAGRLAFGQHEKRQCEILPEKPFRKGIGGGQGCGDPDSDAGEAGIFQKARKLRPVRHVGGKKAVAGAGYALDAVAVPFERGDRFPHRGAGDGELFRKAFARNRAGTALSELS